MKHVTIEEAEWAISRLPYLLNSTEPIGPLDDDAKAKLESAITQPFVHFGGHYHYWYLYQRAAFMFYLIIKDHSMENGNKRSAVTITMYFLYKNGKILNVTPDALYDIACMVAESKPEELGGDTLVEILSRVFKEHITDLR